MNIAKHEKEGPKDEFTLDLIFDVDETQIVIAAYREKVHRLTREGVEIGEFELDVAARERNELTICTSNPENTLETIENFHTVTGTVTKYMADKMEAPFADNALARRHILGKKAGELVTDMRDQSIIFEASQQAALSLIDTEFLHGMGVSAESLAT